MTGWRNLLNLSGTLVLLVTEGTIRTLEEIDTALSTLARLPLYRPRVFLVFLISDNL